MRTTPARRPPERTRHAAERAPIPGARAERLARLVAPLRGYLLDQAMRSRNTEADEVHRCLLELGHAWTALSEAAEDGEATGTVERLRLWPLAWRIRKLGLRHHLTLAAPFWGWSEVSPSPGTVFFAGGVRLNAAVSAACEERGLRVRAAPPGGGPGAARWDDLRSSAIGVFDLTGRSTAERASVCHALGLGLALGVYPVVVTGERETLPFDIDVEPVTDESLLADRIDEALFGVHPTTGATSVVTTARRVLGERAPADPVEAHRLVRLRLQDERRSGEAVLTPVWPARYADPAAPRCFHVMPFSQPWSDTVRDQVREACRRSGTSYRRGDDAEGTEVIRAIWEEIGLATCLVVDLTGLNVNVCLELGLAQALGRPALLFTQDDPAQTLFPEIAKLQVRRYAPGDGRLANLALKAPS